MDETLELGPFRVDEKVGEGGMGAVYRGTHRETGVSVALKVIRQRTEQQTRRHFHQEVQAQAGLFHPGIVYLFEYGEVDNDAAEAFDGQFLPGSPYVAMELADRGTVREAMPCTNWKMVSQFLIQVLDALAYAHARDVIHRDLKPENLLCFDNDGASAGDFRLKVADFGLAHALGRERDAETDRLESTAGTPLYMSPEQFRGRWRQYGPWTDLYSVGCIVWEFVTGHPPFRGDNIRSLALSHLSENRPLLEPQFPVPDGLEAWLHRALAIDPAHRFRRAADAAWILRRDVFTDGWDEPIVSTRDSRLASAGDGGESDDALAGETDRMWQTQLPVLSSTVELEGEADTLPQDTFDDVRPPGGDDRPAPVSFQPPVPDSWHTEQTAQLPAPLVGAGLGLFDLREPPFVDRNDECDRIWSALREVVETETARLLVVAGEAGTGKSRLAEWIATRAHEVGAAMTLRAIHTPEGGSTEGLRGALERRFRTVKMNRGEVYDHLRETLPSLEDGDEETRRQDARALTEYLRPTGGSGHIIGPKYRFSSGHQRRSLLVRVLARLAERRPMLLWLDDLQWGTEARGVLDRLFTIDDPPPVLVLATLRSDVVSEDDHLASYFEDLQSDTASTRVELEPLPRRYQRELLDGLLPLEGDLADRLAERTEGHPLFAMQLLGHWVESGDLEVGVDGFRLSEGRDVALPDNIHELWMDRIDRLLATFPTDAQDKLLRALELAAALGREVSTDEWRAVLDDADLSVPMGLVDRLADRGLVERTSEGWAFAHRLLAESLGHRAQQNDRSRDHYRRCARMLESRLDVVLGPRKRVAQYWENADEPGRALQPLLEEIKLAGERSEDDEVGRLVERRTQLLDALEIPADDPRRIEQQIESARICANRGQFTRAKHLLDDVSTALGTDHPRLQARAADVLTVIDKQLGNLDQTRQWAEHALEASRRAQVDHLQGRAHRRLSWLFFSVAELDRAEKHARRAFEISERVGDRYGNLEALRRRAYLREVRGDSTARSLFDRVRREADEAGYLRIEAEAINGLGQCARFAGDLDEARAHYRAYLEKVEQLSYPISEATARLNLAQVELRAGRFDEARRHLEAADEMLESLGARASKQGLLHLLRLGHGAGLGDESTFQSLWQPLADGWPEEWRLVRDHPWLLETIGDDAWEAGWQEPARAGWRIARNLWQRLGDEDAVGQLDDRLLELDDDTLGDDHR